MAHIALARAARSIDVDPVTNLHGAGRRVLRA
jgi:hypothetical protein